MSSPKPPDFKFMDDAQYERFCALVVSDFAAHGKAVEIVDGMVIAGGDKERPFGLYNVAAACAKDAEETWSATVAEHFRQIRLAVEEGESLMRLSQRFEDVRNILMPRIYQKSKLLGYRQEDFYARNDLEGTKTYVVFDMPTSTTHVNRTHAKTWNMTDAEIFAVAMDNLEKRPMVPTDVDRERSGQTTYFFDGDVFTSTLALRIADGQEWVGPFGALVVIPTRNRLVVHPIEGFESGRVYEILGPYAWKEHSSSPGAVSPFVYWFYKGAFIACGVLDENNIPVPMVPEKLTRLLRGET